MSSGLAFGGRPVLYFKMEKKIQGQVMIRLGNGLLPLNVVVWLLIAATLFFPYDPLRIALGIPFVLLFPGYVLTLALFPEKERLSGIRRVVFSLGLSIAVVPLMGLVLNYTLWGITLEAMLYSIAFFILIMSVVAWVRGKRLPERDRFNIEFQARLPGWSGRAWDKALSVVLVIVIAGVLGMLGYAIARPKVGEQFTEFYTLGLEGKAIDYPREMKVGEEGRVIVGIINREHERVSYRVEVRTDGVSNNQIGPLELAHDEKWEEIVSFTPDRAGDGQKVEFLLYKSEEGEPYLKLHLWVNVKE